MSNDKRTAKPQQLQALLFCDSFTSAFGSPAEILPEILFPVSGTPLLHYTLEFLVSQPVSEIIVASCYNSSYVQYYLQFVYSFCIK